MKLSIIIPAYNEEKRIVKTLENTLDYLNRQPYQSEIIVVCDGNTDNTKGVVTAFAPGPMVILRAERYEPNRGKGYAVRHGMLLGHGELVMFMDADYSVPIEAVEQGMQLIEDGNNDIAIASRAVPGATVRASQNFFRALSGRLYTLIQNIYLGIDYPDTQCGFKIFTRNAAQHLFARQKLDSVIFDPEILWLAKKEGFGVAQFPVAWTHMEDSQIVYDSLRKSLFIFQELFRIKRLHRQ